VDVRADAAGRATGAGRRREIDVIRCLMVGGLILFHTARVFDPLPFYVKHSPPEPILTLLVLFVALWGMPMFFVVSGVAAWHSLGSRKPGEFLRERSLRLLVPLVVGLVLIVPPQLYVRASRNPAFDLSYWAFLPRFFDVRLHVDVPWIVDAAPRNPWFEGAHLWFLYLLFVFSAALLPVFVYLRRPSGRALLQRFSEATRRPLVWMLPAVAVAAAEVGLGTEDTGGWNRWAYVVFLLFGYALAAEPELERSMEGRARAALWTGVVLAITTIVLAYVLAEVQDREITEAYDAGSMALRALKALAGWTWVVAIVGLARAAARRRALRRLSDATATRASEGRVLRFANDAVLPFYVFHQTVIVVIAFYVVRASIPALAQYVVIAVLSLAGTLALVALVRPFAVTRFLFGMKPRRGQGAPERS
jgi:surface polysaccharide O-acyltransferase-like enzyme